MRLRSTVLILILATPAVAADRNVTLRALPSQRIEIANPTDHEITFTLGLNDQLFENKDALLAWVRSSRSSACRHLREAETLALPCAAFERVASAMFHFPELTDQFSAVSWAGVPRLWAESPLLTINSFGFGTCGTFSDVLAKIWHELGYEVRRRELNGHTVTEVKVDRRWRLFDADMRGFFVDNHQVIGIDELLERPQLAAYPVAPSVRSLAGERPHDFPHSDIGFYPGMLDASKTSPWRDPKPVPEGPDDWRELTFTIPAGGRLVFPERAGDDCLYPENTSTPAAAGITDAPHQFAALEIPAGVSTTMRSGLYVGQIVGNFCVNAEYLQGSRTSQTFDQLHRFRFARRFARSISIETGSKVAIYYLLSANVALRKNNEVRLHGDGVEGLRVAAIDAGERVEPQRPPQTCIADAGFDTLEVQKAWASSYSYNNETLGTYLIDGQPASGWISDMLDTDKPQTIVLDLGQPRMISGVRWSPNAQYAMLSPDSIEIDTSVDGNDFREADCVTDYNPDRLEWMERRFEPRMTRYVRLMIVPVPHFLDKDRFQVSLGEIEVIQ